MKLKDYAKLKGISYMKAYRMWKAGNLVGSQPFFSFIIDIDPDVFISLPPKPKRKKSKRPLPPSLLAEVREILSFLEKNYTPHYRTRIISRMSGYPFRQWVKWANNQQHPMNHSVRTIHTVYEIVKNEKDKSKKFNHNSENV